tara:strand:- start:420 stop:647 length:228 start_codon:yes stop_codon:yes gene_type:complete
VQERAELKQSDRQTLVCSKVYPHIQYYNSQTGNIQKGKILRMVSLCALINNFKIKVCGIFSVELVSMSRRGIYSR